MNLHIMIYMYSLYNNYLIDSVVGNWTLFFDSTLINVCLNGHFFSGKFLIHQTVQMATAHGISSAD